MTVIGLDPSFGGFGLSDGTEHAVLVAPPAAEGEERAAATRRRANALAEEVVRWIEARAALARFVHAVYIEAPMLSSTAGAGHLYELGWLMAKVDAKLRAIGITAIVEVETAKLRKFIGLPGNCAKSEIPLRIFKRFGVEFERDAKADKAFAYLLHRYGLAHANGELEHEPARARGQGAKSRAATKRTARTKGAA